MSKSLEDRLNRVEAQLSDVERKLENIHKDVIYIGDTIKGDSRHEHRNHLSIKSVLEGLERLERHIKGDGF